ncbi:lactonase family protein [Paenibacillus xanthanilyticus]|uniref:Lactonase family protein n=1 Tax=Paenibacillus xanthanilyticus TaxID=1783531 RepID=A0ABV8K6X1_9BACL
MSEQQLIVFAGSYAEAADNSIYSYAFNEETGALTLIDAAAGYRNPTFLNVDTANNRLYAISEGTSADGGKAGEAAAFAIDPATGKFEPLNRALTVASPTCHIQRDAGSNYLIVVSYHGGMAGLFAIEEDGRIGKQLDVSQHEGRSVHPERQDRPHPHSAFFSPDGKYLLIQDLGLDKIFTYAIDEAEGKLVLKQVVETNPGSGPRHLAFHPNGSHAYVINEVDSSVTVFAYDAAEGKLSPIQTLSTLPAEGFDGENTTAEIAASEDGRYVYGSNRGHDSLVVYAVDGASGQLSLIQHISSGGGHPRHFALTPGGRYLLCANRDDNNIVTFRVDRETGFLSETGQSVSVSKPVCVKPVYL